MSEKEFRKEITRLAKEIGWRVYHNPTTPANRTAIAADGKGFPDLFLAHKGKGRSIFAELKAGDNKPSDEQLEWLNTLWFTRNEVYVWTEGEGAIDQIIEILGAASE